MKNKGISLIVLIITVIVVIILAAVVILTLSKNNPIESSKEARFKEDVRNFQIELENYIGKKITKEIYIDLKITTTNESLLEEMKEYIPSFSKKYEGKLGIENNNIVYFEENVTEKEEKWLLDLGIGKKKIQETAESDFRWKSNDQNSSDYGVIVEYIGSGTNVILPLRATVIQSRAFFQKNSVRKIVITDNVVNIEEGFIGYNCNNIEEIKVTEGNQRYTSDDGILYSKSKESLICYPPAKSGKEYTVPDYVTSIYKYAFYYCNKLEMLSTGKNVNNIYGNAIDSCTSLKVVNISKNTYSINNYVYGNFLSCGKLEEINVDRANSSYSSENGILYNKDKTEIIYYPHGKEGEFYKLIDSVTSMENFCFKGCNKLKKIDLNNCRNIGFKGFQYCSNLEEIISPNLISLNYYALDGCSKLTRIDLQDGMKSIPPTCFNACSSLESIDLPNTITLIDVEAFRSCSNLRIINIPDSVTKIERNAFSSCVSLNEIFIPASVVDMGQSVFSNINMDIYCEVSSKPSNWNQNWVPYNMPSGKIHWGSTRNE